MFVTAHTAQAQEQKCAGAKYSDSHFHLTNYIQEGTRLQDYLNMMGTAVCRSTVFGIPLQQTYDRKLACCAGVSDLYAIAVAASVNISAGLNPMITVPSAITLVRWVNESAFV